MPRRSFKCAADDEADAAQVGPPDTKLVGSRERAIQRLARLKRLYESAATTLKKWEDAVEEAKTERSWEPLKYKSLDDMLKVELGATEAQAKKRIQQAAVNTTGEVLPKHKHPDRQIADQKQAERASQSGISERTQRKLDKLAREFPELHEQVKAGTLSVHAACIAAGIVKVKTPAEQAMHWLKKCNQEQWDEVMEWIESL